MFLLDTNIVSELRGRNPHKAVLHWLNSVNQDTVFVSAVTMGEIQRGIELTRELDHPKAAEIELWLESLSRVFTVKVMDEHAFRKWAVLMHRKTTDLSMDAMIAAIAITNDLTIVTRNVRDFALLGIPVLNPFESQ